MAKDAWPEEGEFVVCTVRNVKGFGAFAMLDEYPGKEGFIHITEIAPGWIKHIKDHVREGQKIVCKVLKVQEDKGHIDLSLKQVNDHQKREKIMQWKANQKAEKLLEVVAEKLGWTVEKCREEFADALEEEFGTLYSALEEIAINPDVLDEIGLDGEWKETLINVTLENIQPPYVEIKGVLKLMFHSENGIDELKEVLKKASSIDLPKGVKLNISYIGAPKYMVKVHAPDYKTAEEVLSRCIDTAISLAKEYGAEHSFERISRER